MSTVEVPASVPTHGDASDSAVARVQHLPCRIEHRGPANVDTFFSPLVRPTEAGVLEAQFRGHPLDGSVIALPAGYEGLVTRVEETPDGTKYVATEKFSRYTSWNWDSKPSANDPAAKLLDWLAVADAVHSTDDRGQ